MQQDIVKKIINVLFISSDEMSVKEIASILAIEISDIEKSIEKVANTLADAGLNLINNNDKLLITTSSEYSDVIKSFYSYTVASDLSPAQLQTLTIIAYLASATVSQISFVRGVQSLQTVRALSTRGLIEKDRRVSTEDIETINAVVLALPLNPLCQDDCQGLCATCGERYDDLPDDAATHDNSHDTTDARWGALAGLLEQADSSPDREK